MKKKDKSNVIASIASLVKEYDHFYVTNIEALNSEATSALRRRCFADGVKLMVVKNSLLIKALDSLDEDYSALYSSLKGNSALMLCNTGNVPAKLIKEVGAKSGVPALKAAFVEGCFYGPDQLETLVHVKSKNELIADVVALLQSPAKNVVSALQSGGNILHGVLKTLGERE